MQTLVKYEYKEKSYEEVVNCPNAPSGGAYLLLRHPNLDRSRLRIINCVGASRFKLPSVDVNPFRNS